MEGIIILLVIAVVVCAIAGFAMALRLQGRVRLLEHRMALAEGQLRSAAAPIPETGAEAVPTEVPVPEAIPEPAAPPAGIVPPIPPAAPEPSPPEALVTRPPSRTLEVQLGTRWAVWIGGLALAFGGIFLVRYSIEQGLLGPGARIAAGAAFACALLAAGEWIRRREGSLAVPGVPTAHVPSVLTAAGTLTAFGTAYAAHALYGLIGPAAAFILLGLIAILTMVAAALHGPALAGLGLAASLASPLLVSSDQPNPWPVVLYLVFAVGAAYGVARLRLWRWLAVAAAAGAQLWTPVFLVEFDQSLPGLVHIAVQIGLAGLFLVADPYRATADRDARPDRLATLVLLGFALLAVLATGIDDLGDARLVFAGLCAAMMLGLAVRFAPAAAAALWAGLIGTGTLLLWPIAGEIAAEPLTVYPGPFGNLVPEALRTFLAFALLVAASIGAVTTRRIARGRDLPLSTAGWLVAAGTVTPLACLVVAYGRVTALERHIPFALAAAGLAVAFASAARWLWGMMEPAPERPAIGLGPPDDNGAVDGSDVTQGGTAAGADAIRLGVGGLAAGSLAALALGLTFALDRGMLTVAFALIALGTAWVADRIGLPMLRWAVAAVGLLVLGRLVWDPTIVGGNPGSLPVFNWLLWGYGVPALCFFAASRLLERSGRDWTTRFTESLAIAFAAFLAVFEIRHAVHGSLDEPLSDHLEAGLMAASALVFSLVLVRADIRRPDPVYRAASQLFSLASLLIAGFALLISTNPLLTDEPVRGGALLNSLVPAYLLPAILAGCLALAARGARPQAYVWGAAGGALVLHLAYMVLAIRRIFQGPEIGIDLPATEGEQWSYSLALLACGLVVLALGWWRNIRFLRLASAVYLALAVLKVFILDLASLEGIMRALSFIGLGLTLIGIALVYQRVLARRPEAAGPA